MITKEIIRNGVVVGDIRVFGTLVMTNIIYGYVNSKCCIYPNCATSIPGFPTHSVVYNSVVCNRYQTNKPDKYGKHCIFCKNWISPSYSEVIEALTEMGASVKIIPELMDNKILKIPNQKPFNRFSEIDFLID
jgi:hypothetical protein